MKKLIPLCLLIFCLIDVNGQKAAASKFELDTIKGKTDSCCCIKYRIGDFAHGGIVFWVDETRQHGLVCAKTDQSNEMPWSAGTHTKTMALGDGPYSGKTNTILIIASQGFGNGKQYAASLCHELQITENGTFYGDWYLPSREELNLMYLNRDIIDSTALAKGGGRFFRVEREDIRNLYWSSTDFDYRNPEIDLKINWDQGAYSHDFTRGDKDSQVYSQKFLPFSVRAIRAF